MMARLSIKRITLVVFFAASFSLAWQFYRIGREWIASQRAHEQWVVVCASGPSRDVISRNEIELFLILALVGSRLKGIKNTLLSAVGLSGAATIYILWWQYIFRLASLAEVDVTSMRHVAYLYHGNYLDVLIAGLILLLIALNVSKAARSLFLPTALGADSP